MSEDDIGSEIKKSLRWLTWATVALYLIALLTMGWVWKDAQNGSNSLRASEGRTTIALCALREDLNQRVLSSQQFLVDNPAGIPGITVASVQASIVSQQRTVNALAGLHC